MDILSPSDAAVAWDQTGVVTVHGRIKCLRWAQMESWLRNIARAIGIQIKTCAKQGLLFKEVDYWVTGMPERVDIFTYSIRHFIHLLQEQKT